jgi:nucleolar protein 14
MAGSQLKQLKAALKEGGLTGQTNIKKKKGTKKAPSDTRRDDKQEVISKIREQFNPFEIKVNKKKKDYDTTRMKGGQGKPGISKQIGEEQRMAAYEAKKAQKNKSGLMRDRRFGEADSTLTPEQKMLERFTREKQMQSKTSLFSLDDEDDEMDDDEGLTHYGKSLAVQDDFVVDHDLQGSDDDFMKPRKRSLEDVEDAEDPEGEIAVPQKKKTKAEVMKEVIAKSKFYKQQRQIIQEKAQEKIMDLDEEFDDVMSDLRQIPKQKPAQKIFNPEDGPSYEMTVKELAMDRRAAPADRTKTDEEIKRERAEKMRELESARLRRMEAMDEQEKGPDDLDDDFWVKGSEDEGEGFAVGGPSEDDESEEGVEEHHESGSTPKAVITCPESHEDWLDLLEELPFEETVPQANKILKTFAPHLMHGNKEKLAVFTVILFQHILYLSESNQINDEKFTEVQEGLISLVKKLSEKYNIELTEALRDKIQEIHERIVMSLGGDDEFPMISDLTFFTVVGMVYSTSDHFHLIVTPASIVMGEALEQLKYTSLNTLLGGSFISQVFLLYQRYSKRYIPEVVYFLQKALLSIAPTDISGDDLTAKPDVRLPLPTKISSKIESLRISDVDRELGDSHKFALFQQILSTLELALDTWKDKTALIEISKPFVTILSQLQETYPDFKPVVSLSQKFNRLLKFSRDERKPLALQEHKKLAIATYAPKFEENFNPEKKSYDPNRQRQEINKMRSQVKQERKIALREMRKDTRFEARQQIKEKKESYAAYHSKMARIMNQINTVEGAEKNEYEREKKLRKGKK